MRMTLARIGKNLAPLRLFATLVFLPLFAPLCHAQCFDGASGGGVYAIISPSHFAPGQSYNASVTVPSGGFNPDTECPTPAVLYIVNAASYGQGLYYQEDPYVTVSNLAYVSTTEITFTVTVASNAPTESDAWADISGDGAGGAGGSVWLVSNLEAVSITPCALPLTPTISSIQPTAFFAGESTTVTITGTGFMPTTNANSCAPTTVAITAGTENVTLSSVNVVSPTQITVMASPQASDPLETASITSSNYQLNGPPYFLTSNAEPAEIPPTPAIQFNNNIVSGANAPTLSAVVGAAINLTTTPTAATLAALPVPITLSQSAWTVGGTNIGGYTPTPSSFGSATVSATTLNKPTLNTYWVYAGSSQKVTYQYCVNVSGLNPTCSVTATATFNITGPSGISMTANGFTGSKGGGPLTIQNWPINGCSFAAGNWFVYGDIQWTSCTTTTGTPGITFVPSGSYSGSGQFFNVQLVTSGVLTGGMSCTIVPGLDATTDYPYPYFEPGTNDAVDSPGVFLKSTYTQQARTEDFMMYIMFQPGTNPSVMVPIGYEDWGFSGSASCSKSCGTASNWSAKTISSGPVGKFVASKATQPNYGYPTWGGLVACH